jgi:hypothetical protein
LIQGFSLASQSFLNELNNIRERDGVWRLPDSTEPNDRRREQITPQYYKIREALRAEVEASRDLVAWFRYQIDKWTKP